MYRQCESRPDHTHNDASNVASEIQVAFCLTKSPQTARRRAPVVPRALPPTQLFPNFFLGGGGVRYVSVDVCCFGRPGWVQEGPGDRCEVSGERCGDPGSDAGASGRQSCGKHGDNHSPSSGETTICTHSTWEKGAEEKGSGRAWDSTSSGWTSPSDLLTHAWIMYHTRHLSTSPYSPQPPPQARLSHFILAAIIRECLQGPRWQVQCAIRQRLFLGNHCRLEQLGGLWTEGA